MRRKEGEKLGDEELGGVGRCRAWEGMKDRGWKEEDGREEVTLKLRKSEGRI